MDLRMIPEMHSNRQAEVRATTELGEWLDSSKVDLFNLCPRKFYYRHELHLVPKEGSSSAMDFGTALHAALASYYDGSGFEMVHCPCPDFTGCEFCKGQLIPRMAMLFLIHYPVEPQDDHDPRTRKLGIEMLHAYLERFRRDGFEVVGVEIPFAVEFCCQASIHQEKFSQTTAICGHCKGHAGHPGLVLFTYIGRIDLLTREDGKLKPYDHKSTTRFGLHFENSFKLSGQCTGYMHSAGTIVEEPILSMGINALRVTTKISPDSFIRITTTRRPDEFDEWNLEVRHVFKQILENRRNGFWPKHSPFSCSAYNRTCEYYGLCSSSPEQRPELIANNFDKIPWNPISED